MKKLLPLLLLLFLPLCHGCGKQARAASDPPQVGETSRFLLRGTGNNLTWTASALRDGVAYTNFTTVFANQSGFASGQYGARHNWTLPGEYVCKFTPSAGTVITYTVSVVSKSQAAIYADMAKDSTVAKAAAVGSPMQAGAMNNYTTYWRNADVKTSTRSTLTASDVWSYSTRILSSFGTLVADMAASVWSAAARTLTSAGSVTAADVWSYDGGRTVTGGSVTANVQLNSTTVTNIAAQVAAHVGSSMLLPFQGAASYAGPVAVGSTISMFHNDTPTIPYAITANKVAFNLTDYTITWSAKRNPTDTTYVVPVTDITANVISAVVGTGNIPITTAKSVLLIPGTYTVDLDIAKTNNRFMVFRFTLNVLEANQH